VLPRRAQVFIEGSAVPMGMFLALGLTGFLILTLAAIVAMLRREYTPSILATVLLVLFGFISYASFEFTREGLRKPYVIEGFMYSTGVTTAATGGLDTRANLGLLQRRGVLSAATWALPAGRRLEDLDTMAKGQAVFRAACGVCHQPDAGYNALRPVVRHWTAPTIHEYLNTMHEQKPMMPPFPGTDQEKNWLTVYVDSLTERETP
jgi:mono/diheme cytochrome c family protein